MEIMAPHFRPEFLGRLTEIIPFSPDDGSYGAEHFESAIKILMLRSKNKVSRCK